MYKVLIVSFICLAALSCSRDSSEQLRQVTITGSVYDSSNRVPMKNVTVLMTWYNAAGQGNIVDSVKTDAQGNFSIKTIFDLMRFNTQTLEIAAVVPNGFISIFDLDHTTVGASFKGFGAMDTWRLAPFIIHQKADLTINLQRNGNDNFNDIELTYNYHIGSRNYWVNLGSSRPNGSMTRKVVTAAGVKTRVSWKKNFSSGPVTSFQDSTIVLANTANSITVGY
jgi:hypothetical protein